MGLVAQSFQEEELGQLTGHIAIGHTRYSTAGSSHLRNAQPIVSEGPDISLALAHNGNVVNAVDLRDELVEWGLTFNTTSDSEIIAHLLVHGPAATWEERVAYMMRRVRGAYSLTVMTKDQLLGMRDPLGVRPLCVGRLNGGYVVTSETCALDHIGAELVREVEPGEAVLIDSEGMRTVRRRQPEGRVASCMFEHIYFARPDSALDGKRVYTSRMAMGAELAREHPVEAGHGHRRARLGHGRGRGILPGVGHPIRRRPGENRYVGRTFINPDQRLRDLGVRTKYNPLPELIGGKRLVVVDDSIVRGTTTPHTVGLLKKGGASEIHLRICAPPIMYPAIWGWTWRAGGSSWPPT